MLHVSERLKEAIPEAPIIAYRRPRNLRDLLVRAELKPISEDTEHNGNSPCNNRRFKTCQHIKVIQTLSKALSLASLTQCLHPPPARRKILPTSSSAGSAENSMSGKQRMPYTSASMVIDRTSERIKQRNQ